MCVRVNAWGIIFNFTVVYFYLLWLEDVDFFKSLCVGIIMIIMHINHALINAQSAHMIYINLNMIFYTHVEHSPTKTIYIKYYSFFFF